MADPTEEAFEAWWAGYDGRRRIGDLDVLWHAGRSAWNAATARSAKRIEALERVVETMANWIAENESGDVHLDMIEALYQDLRAALAACEGGEVTRAALLARTGAMGEQAPQTKKEKRHAPCRNPACPICDPDGWRSNLYRVGEPSDG